MSHFKYCGSKDELKELSYSEKHPFLKRCPHCASGWNRYFYDHYLYCPWCGTRYIYLRALRRAICIRKSEIHTTTLSRKHWEAFYDIIQNGDMPNKALREAAERWKREQKK